MTDVFREGQVLNDRYRVLRRLGGGGMADVYLCEDLTLDRRVAIKVLLERFRGDAQFLERFRREAKAAAGLNHPNVVGIHDWGEVEGVPYIVMEYVEGETLKDLIRRRGRLNGNDAVRITLGLLAAVQFAHRNDIVHRDIKAQNILLDGAGNVKVTDFGIARAGDSGMTEAGSILGTAQYIAPEQARGLPVDERSDLYSVGVVLYEMLTGAVPFTGDSAVTVAMKHVNETAPEPATLVPGMPHSLNQIVLKALAKDPDQRYANAEQFARDLEAARGGGEVTAAGFDPDMERTAYLGAGTSPTRVMSGPPPAPPEDEGGRRRWPWILLVILLAVIGVTGFLLWRSLSGEKADVPSVVGLAQAAAERKLEDAGFKVKVSDEYSDEFAEGFVSRQEPGEGTRLRVGGTVEIWVSRGASTVTLPSFRGWKVADVEAWLEGNGLRGVQKKGRSDAVASGRVYKQDPAAGSEVQRDGEVTYWVSTGRPQVAVPDLSGMTQADAQAALADAGLVLGTVSTESSTSVTAGLVIRQDPAAGTKVADGAAVSIVVSSGSPSPSPSPSPSLIQVPDVYGMDAGNAANTLQTAGFVVVVKQQPSIQPPNTVIKMKPDANTMAPKGSTVTITVAK